MRSASARLGRHAFRMFMFLVLLASFATLMVYAGLGISRVFPKRKVVRKVTNDVADPVGDDYRPFAEVDSGERIPGGSEILEGIDSSLAAYGVYNDTLRNAAIDMGWDDTMLGRDVLLGREVVLDTKDEWTKDDAVPEYAGKNTMSREVTMFNL